MADDNNTNDEHAVRLREDATGWRKVDGPRLTEDDPFLTGLTEAEAENLVRSNWALVHADAADAPDVEKWEDWNEEDWMDLGYQQRAEDVREGRVDDHLDAIEDVETSDNVTEAVDERRAELDGADTDDSQEE